MKKFFFAALCLVLSVSFSLAQTEAKQVDYMSGGAIPSELKVSLNSRFEEFIKAVNDKRWETVNDILGDFGTRSGGSRYSANQKQCLIDLIKATPINSFKPTKISQSSAIFSRPLDQGWWLIRGIGAFKTESGDLSKEITFIAYRDKSNWFLSPGFYISEWNDNKIKQTAEANFANYISIVHSKDAPVEIQNISVTSLPDTLLRKLTFDVYNKSPKTIDGISYQIISGNGRTMVSSPKEIKPNEKASFDVSISPIIIFCEGEQSQNLFIDTVWFTDETEWKLK